MPFIVPFIPAIASAVGAGASVYSAVKGKGGGGGGASSVPSSMSPEELAALAAQTDLTKLLTKNYSEMFGIAKPAFEDVASFWGPILKGDQTQIAQLMGPEMDIIGKQHDVARKNVLNFSPRGGAREFALSQAPIQQASDVQNLLVKARPQAAAAMTGLGTTTGQLATGAAGTATAGGGDVLNFLNQRRGQEIQKGIAERGQNIGIGQGLGQGLGAILKSLLGMKGGGASPYTPSVGGVINTGSGSILNPSYIGTPFAEGGVVTKPTLALIGEEGPEAVVPLKRSKISQATARGEGPASTISDILARLSLPAGEAGGGGKGDIDKWSGVGKGLARLLKQQPA